MSLTASRDGARSLVTSLAAPLLASVILLLPILARVPLRQREGGQAHLALAQELVACIAVSIAAFVVARGRSSAQTDGATLGLSRSEAVLLVGISVLEVVSAALSDNPWVALRSTTVVLSGVATYLVARTLGGRCNETVSLVPLLAMLLVSVSVLLEAFGITPGWSRSGHAPGGLLGERNSASEFLVCGLPFVVSMVIEDERRRVRLLACVVLGAAAASIVFSRTRSAWLAMGVLAVLGVSCVVWKADDRISSRAGGVVVSVATGLVLALALPTRLAWKSSHPYGDTLAHLLDRSSDSGAGRMVQYANTWEMSLAHPLFGVGPGNWSGHYLAFAAPDDPTVRASWSAVNRLPSSDVLGFVAERGFVAAALLVALGIILARRRADGDALVWLRRATMLGVLVVGSFDAVLQLAPHLLLVAWILGTSMPKAARVPEASPSEPSGPMFRVPVRLLGALAVALALAAPLAAARTGAFVLFVRARSLDDFARAAMLDPGNVPQLLAMAESWANAGRCDEARSLVARAGTLSVPSPFGAELEIRCRDSVDAR